MADYDKIIEKFCCEWEERARELKHDFLMLSLTRHIVPILYSDIRYKYLKERITVNNSNILAKIKNTRFALKRIAWIILWSVKWILKKDKIKNKKVILAAVGSDRKLTEQYLEHIINYAESNDSIVISLNIPCFRKTLINKNILYFNRFTKNYLRHKNWDNLFNNIYDVAEELFKKYFNINLNEKEKLRSIFKSYYRDYQAFESLIERLNLQKIKFLLVDFDYTANKIIYNRICKKNNIATISVDHSIQFYNHLFKKNFSDLRLVWGEYSKQRIISNSDNNLPKINIVGKPGNFLFKNNKKRGSDWLYILSPYSEPAYQTIYRSLALSREYYLAIMSVLEKRGINKKLYIKSHPEDGNIIAEYFTLPDKNNYRFINKSIFKYLENFELIFIEDTTLILDLALYNIPIIYLADRSKKDIFNISKANSIGFAESVETLEKEIEVQVGNSINENDRLNFINYFINTSKKFETELHDSINNFLEYR